MNPIDPRKNEKAFVMAAVFFAISGDIALTRFVGGTHRALQ